MLRKLINLFLQQMINKKALPFQAEAIDPFYSIENQNLLAERIAKYKIGVKTENELIDNE
jgi:antitoxin component of RelBE/YafQ-DinJ toxin-antitoxin module